jgi:curved DNA-binding protein CbpA
MDTLYDLLGALPRDDADGLRAAFRRAVKGAHPDLNPGDPHAGQKFRQIVRAHEILADGEQRAAYDHLLELARIEATEQARAGRVHRLASWVMAFAGVSAVSMAGLALVALLWSSTEPAADTGPSTDELAHAKVTSVPEQSFEPEQPLEAPADPKQPSLGPPLDITPAPAPVTIEHRPGMEGTVAHGRPAVKRAHLLANPKREAAGTTGARPSRPTFTTDLSRLESAPFNPRP